MATLPDTTTYVIDATGKRLGVLATEVASLLIGKNRTDLVRHIAPDVQVTVQNARFLDVPEKKASKEVYQTYSGYPGGLKIETLGHLAERRGYGEVIRRSVRGMLPKNKLRDVRLKKLTISE